MGLLDWVPTIEYNPRKAKIRKGLKEMEGPKSLTTRCYYCDNTQRTRANKNALEKLETNSKVEKKIKRYSGSYDEIEEWKLSRLWIKVECGSCGKSYMASFPEGELSYSSKETEVKEGRHESEGGADSTKDDLLDIDYSGMKDIVELYNSGKIDSDDLEKLRDSGEISDTWYDIIRGKNPGS